MLILIIGRPCGIISLQKKHGGRHMNKKEVAAFFDRMAPEWDAEMIKSDEKINFIDRKSVV